MQSKADSSGNPVLGLVLKLQGTPEEVKFTVRMELSLVLLPVAPHEVILWEPLDWWWWFAWWSSPEDVQYRGYSLSPKKPCSSKTPYLYLAQFFSRILLLSRVWREGSVINFVDSSTCIPCLSHPSNWIVIGLSKNAWAEASEERSKKRRKEDKVVKKTRRWRRETRKRIFHIRRYLLLKHQQQMKWSQRLRKFKSLPWGFRMKSASLMLWVRVFLTIWSLDRFNGSTHDLGMSSETSWKKAFPFVASNRSLEVSSNNVCVLFVVIKKVRDKK